MQLLRRHRNQLDTTKIIGFPFYLGNNPSLVTTAIWFEPNQ